MTGLAVETGAVLTRYYLGGRYELDVTLGNTREKLYLGGDAYSAPMVYVRDNNSDWVLYDIIRDYQGSITHLVDNSDGTIVAEYSYDPWTLMTKGYHQKENMGKLANQRILRS